MSINLKKRIYTSIGLLLLLLLLLINNYALGYFLIIFGIFAILEFSSMTMKIYKKNRLKKFLLNLLFFLYIFSFCSVFLIFSSYLNLKILIFLILITCIASDIGGFVCGKTFEGPKLTKISPNKTISGAVGSLIFSLVVLSIFIFYLTENFNPYFLIIGLTTSIGCQLGDLFFSFMKRKSFLKDTGDFLPGHGGVLDRIDGILLGMPLGFLTLLLIY